MDTVSVLDKTKFLRIRKNIVFYNYGTKLLVDYKGNTILVLNPLDSKIIKEINGRKNIENIYQCLKKTEKIDQKIYEQSIYKMLEKGIILLRDTCKNEKAIIYGEVGKFYPKSILIELTNKLKEEFDYILVDCPAGIEQGFQNAIAPADRAVVVTTPEVSSIRDADRIIGLLEAAQIKKTEMLINRIRPAMVARGEMMSVEDVTEILAIPLIGVLTDQEDIVIASNQGEPLAGKDSPAGQAFLNIARRLMGEAVPFPDLSQEDTLFQKLRQLFKKNT